MFFLGKKVVTHFVQSEGSFALEFERASPAVVWLRTTKSLSFAVALGVLCMDPNVSLGALRPVAGDNRVTEGQKKGTVRWYKVVRGCDDLKQVPGGSKMEIGLP